MKMSNSSLVSYTRISPNSNNPRNNKILKITPHHTAGNVSIETLGEIFASSSRGASSNYGIGTDGRIGMYVEEKNRSWCSSSPSNDNQAITIEVANDCGAPDWHISDKAIESLINLCVDICQRNGISKLNYTGDASGNLTRHNMFANTNCPGPYLQSKFPYIAEEVNKRLNGGSQEGDTSGTSDGKFSIGDKVIINGPLYVSSDANAPAGSVSNKVTNITRIAKGAKHPYNTTGDLGWMDASSVRKYGEDTGLNIGDQVVINGPLYVSSDATSPSGSISNKTTNITRIAKGAKHPYNTTGDLGWMDASSITKVSGGNTYVVQEGDTLSEIAAKYGKTWQEVYAKNKFVIGNNPNVIIPGQKLNI